MASVFWRRRNHVSRQAAAQGRRGQMHFDRVADVLVVGAGASGLPAAIMAREQGASVRVTVFGRIAGREAALARA